MDKFIRQLLDESSACLNAIGKSEVKLLAAIGKRCVDVIESDNKIILFGNGGSAADSQHIACELVGKFNKFRKPYPALALTTNTSNLTAIANDFDYSEIFLRQISSLGCEGDIAWGITTSGNSLNVIKGIQEAKDKGLTTIVFTGEKGGKIKDLPDYNFRVPSDKTPRIQELHIIAAHIICEVIEEEITSKDANQSP